MDIQFNLTKLYTKAEKLKNIYPTKQIPQRAEGMGREKYTSYKYNRVKASYYLHLRKAKAL